MKKFLPILLSSAMLLSTFTGCGSKADSTTAEAAQTPSTQEATATETPTESADPTQLSAEITWWAFPTFATIDDTAGKYEQSIIDAFNQKYPNIKVNLEMIDFASGPEKIMTAIQGGTVCDVLFDAPGRIIDYGKQGVLADLNDMFDDATIKDINNANIIGSCSAGDTQYMYPLSSAPFLMAVNKTKLEELGMLDLINLEGDHTWTTDQYQKYLEAMKASGEQGAVVFCSSQGGDQGTRAFIANLYDTTITDAALTKYTINDANGVKGLEFIQNAVNNGLLLNGTAMDGTAAIEEFVAGRVSHTLLWSPGLQKNNAEKLKFETAMLPLPSADGTPDLEYLVNGFCVFNNNDDTKIQASKLFIDFICNDPEWGPKNVLATNAFPVRQSFGNLYPNDETMTYIAGLTKYYGTYYNTIDGFAQMRTAWFPALQAVFAGDKTPQEALDDFVEAADASIVE